jgi:hypothetical protein
MVAQLPMGEQRANTVASLPPPGATKEPIEPVRGEQNVNYGDAIEVLYKGNPQLTVREIADQVGCSLSTANKWLQRLKVPNE